MSLGFVPIVMLTEVVAILGVVTVGVAAGYGELESCLRSSMFKSLGVLDLDPLFDFSRRKERRDLSSLSTDSRSPSTGILELWLLPLSWESLEPTIDEFPPPVCGAGLVSGMSCRSGVVLVVLIRPTTDTEGAGEGLLWFCRISEFEEAYLGPLAMSLPRLLVKIGLGRGLLSVDRLPARWCMTFDLLPKLRLLFMELVDSDFDLSIGADIYACISVKDILGGKVLAFGGGCGCVRIGDSNTGSCRSESPDCRPS
jgi:hypothetical protein